MTKSSKKIWILWAIAIPYIILVITSILFDHIEYSFLFTFIYLPLLLLLGLILHVRKSLVEKKVFYRNVKFWMFLIPLIILVAFLLYFILFNLKAMI